MQFCSFMMNIYYFYNFLKKLKEERQEGRKDGGKEEGRVEGREEEKKTLTWELGSFNFPPLCHCGVHNKSLLYKWAGLVSKSLHLSWNGTSKKQEAHYLLAMPQSPLFMDQASLSALSFMGLIDQGRSSFCVSQHVMGLLPWAWNQHGQSPQVIIFLKEPINLRFLFQFSLRIILTWLSL